MINTFDAVFQLYPSVVKMIENVAYDAEGNTVTYDKDAVQAYVTSKAYIAKRQAEYPPMTDYLDAIVKGDEEQKQAYIDACLAIKAKYPKG
jgi:hypothetical protein